MKTVVVKIIDVAEEARQALGDAMMRSLAPNGLVEHDWRFHVSYPHEVGTAYTTLARDSTAADVIALLQREQLLPEGRSSESTLDTVEVITHSLEASSEWDKLSDAERGTIAVLSSLPPGIYAVHIDGSGQVYLKIASLPSEKMTGESNVD